MCRCVQYLLVSTQLVCVGGEGAPIDGDSSLANALDLGKHGGHLNDFDTRRRVDGAVNAASRVSWNS